MYYELLELGIVKKCPKIHLTELVGDYNYLGKAMEIGKEMDDKVECVPSYAETRQLVLEYAILPLGTAHHHTPTESLQQWTESLLNHHETTTESLISNPHQVARV